MWEETVQQIKDYLSQQAPSTPQPASHRKSPRTEEKEVSPFTTSPPLKAMNALKLKKEEELRRRLSTEGSKGSETKDDPSTSGVSALVQRWKLRHNTQPQGGATKEQMEEGRIVNRYIEKTLKSEEDTHSRVQQLIASTQRIKDISRLPQIAPRNRTVSTKPPVISRSPKRTI